VAATHLADAETITVFSEATTVASGLSFCCSSAVATMDAATAAEMVFWAETTVVVTTAVTG